MTCAYRPVPVTLQHLPLVILVPPNYSALKEINKMAQTSETHPEPPIFVLKQAPQESITAFEARISNVTQEISGSDCARPVILYSVAQPDYPPTTALFAS